MLGLGLFVAAAGLVRHRYAVTNWITAGSRVQQLLIRRAAHLGADLPKQVATGEVVAASANDVERIGNAYDILPADGRRGHRIPRRRSHPGLEQPDPRHHRARRRTPVVARGRTAGAARSSGANANNAPTSVSRKSWPPTPSLACACCAASAAKTSSSTGSTPSRRRCRRQPCAPHVSGRCSTPCRCSCPGLFVVVVTWLGARLALQGELTVGQLVAFYGYTAFLVLPLRTVTEAAHKWTAARVASARVVRVLTLDRMFDEGGEEPDVVSPPRRLARSATPRPAWWSTPGQMTAVVTDDPDASDVLIDRLGRYRDSPTSCSTARRCTSFRCRPSASGSSCRTRIR